MKKRRQVKGDLVHHPLLPTGILMTVWRNPDDIATMEDAHEAMHEMEQIVVTLHDVVDKQTKRINRMEARIRKIEAVLKRIEEKIDQKTS